MGLPLPSARDESGLAPPLSPRREWARPSPFQGRLLMRSTYIAGHTANPHHPFPSPHPQALPRPSPPPAPPQPPHQPLSSPSPFSNPHPLSKPQALPSPTIQSLAPSGHFPIAAALTPETHATIQVHISCHIASVFNCTHLRSEEFFFFCRHLS